MIEIISVTATERRLSKLRRIADGRNVALDKELMSTVAAILDDVRRRGDAALIEHTLRFDGFTLRRDGIRVDEESLRASAEQIDRIVLEALREAIKRVRHFHEQERQESWEIEPSRGVRLGQRIMPIERAGLYVPGGSASYPSSVVMNVVPAQVAGVERIIVATPPRTLKDNPALRRRLSSLA